MAAFKISFFTVFSFQKLAYLCTLHRILNIIYLVAHAILKFWFHLFHNFGKILTIRAKYLFKLFFWSIIFLVFSWNSNYPYTFVTMSTMPHILFCTLLFSPWALLWIYSIDPSFYSLIISYSMFDMMLNPSAYLLMSVIISV